MNTQLEEVGYSPPGNSSIRLSSLPAALHGVTLLWTQGCRPLQQLLTFVALYFIVLVAFTCRVGSSSVATERPSTAQRDRGRIPLTVLAAEQQQPDPEVTAGLGSMTAPATTARTTTSRAPGAATSRSGLPTSRQQDEQQEAKQQQPLTSIQAHKTSGLKVRGAVTVW